MRVDTQKKLFAGVRIDSRMREQLEKCPQRDRVFFESEDGKYLTVLRGVDETYIGKVLPPATELRTVDDIRRNIWSILQRVCPGRRDEGEVKLFTLTEEEATFAAPKRGGGLGAASSPGLGMGLDKDKDGDYGKDPSGDRDDYY